LPATSVQAAREQPKPVEVGEETLHRGVAREKTSLRRLTALRRHLTSRARVLEIGVRDRTTLGFRFLGACDDPDGEIRLEIKREKGRARSRKFRASHSTGAKRGRPALDLSPEEKQARIRAQATERKRKSRMSRKNSSRDIKCIDSVTHFSVTHTPPRINFTAFGIIAVEVMRGNDVVAAWRR